jgi:hypothetical protein
MLGVSSSRWLSSHDQCQAWMRGHNDLMGCCNGTTPERKVGAQPVSAAKNCTAAFFTAGWLGGMGAGITQRATRNGRFGWWWDVGGIWYFYPDQIDGPPDYMSIIEVADDETAASSDPAAATEPHYAFYYRPEELSDTRYQTFDECSHAREQAGVGVCVLK